MADKQPPLQAHLRSSPQKSLDYCLPPSCKAKLKKVWLCTCFVRRFRSPHREAARQGVRPLCLSYPQGQAY